MSVEPNPRRPGLSTTGPLVSRHANPIAALFREWQTLKDQILDRADLTDDQLTALNEQRGDIEFEIWKVEAATPINALRKVCAVTMPGASWGARHDHPRTPLLPSTTSWRSCPTSAPRWKWSHMS